VKELNLPINHQFLINQINKTCFYYKGLKTTKESWSILRYKCWKIWWPK